MPVVAGLVERLCDTGLFERCTEPASNARGVRDIQAIRLTQVSNGSGDDAMTASEAGTGSEDGRRIAIDNFVQNSAVNIVVFVQTYGPFREHSAWSWTMDGSVAAPLDDLEPGTLGGTESALHLRRSIRRQRLGERPLDDNGTLILEHFVRDFGQVRTNESIEED